MMKYRFNPEARIRYEYYTEKLFDQYIQPSQEYRMRLRKAGVSGLQIPSISGAVHVAKKRAKKEAKKMVKHEKYLAQLNRVKLKNIPRTEWAVNPYD